MKASDIGEKVANQARLTAEELQFWKRYLDETQTRNSQTAGFTLSQGGLDIKFPFSIIYSQTLEAVTSSVNINIPPNYKHIIMIISGRTESATTGSDTLLGVFNGDTGAHQYVFQTVAGHSSTADTNLNTAGNPTTVLGGLAGGGLAAGKTDSNFIVLPDYRSNLRKRHVALHAGNYDATYEWAEFVVGTWLGTDPINNIDISMSGVGADFSAGTTISLYGIY